VIQVTYRCAREWRYLDRLLVALVERGGHINHAHGATSPSRTHDAHWLERFEQQELGAGAWGAHSTAFRAKRDIEGLDAGWIGT
jgi:hypothetical protein